MSALYFSFQSTRGPITPGLGLLVKKEGAVGGGDVVVVGAGGLPNHAFLLWRST